MERKRARYKGPTIDWNNKEKRISKKTFIFLTNEEQVENSAREIQTHDEKDLQQSCIFDPAFIVHSSSSNSAESSSSNEWVNCEDDPDLLEEEKPQAAATSVMQNRKFELTDFQTRKNVSLEEPSGNEGAMCHQSYMTPLYENLESQALMYKKYKPDNQNETSMLLLPREESNSYDSDPFINKVQVYKSRVEPYFDENLIGENSQTLLSNISKLYIGGYGDLTSLKGYISESDTSVFSEDSTKRAIKSILKRGVKNPMVDNPKKKVRFDLDLRTVEDLRTDINHFSLDMSLKEADEKLDSEPKTEAKPTELNSSVVSSKEQMVEQNVSIYREEYNCQQYFTNVKCSPKLKNDDVIKTPVLVRQEGKDIVNDSLAINELLKETPTLQKANSVLQKKHRTKNIASVTKTKPVLLKTKNTLKDAISFTSIGVQSDDFESDTESFMRSKFRIQNNRSRELGRVNRNTVVLESDKSKKVKKDSQSLTSEGEYSLFIKDLVSGSGDRLAKFLISLSSEISSKSGDEKIANALMSVGIFQKKNEPLDILNSVQRKMFEDNVELKENKENNPNIREEGIDSIRKNNRNLLNPNEKKLLINNRRSMSEINIRELKAKEPRFDTYAGKKFHSERLDQLYIKKTEDDCMWHRYSKNNPNTNVEVMGRLYEIMNELKHNVDKICRKESTIRIENAQIWLKENKQFEKNMPSDGLKTEIISENTKETYSQTIETIGVHVDHVQRQAKGKTEILIVSNSKNEEINIKVNDKNIENQLAIPSTESEEQNKTNDKLNEIEERKRFFDENKHIPFNVVFNERSHLPTLKKGQYEVEIFEKIDGEVVHETNFKHLMKKLTDNLSNIKLNGLHSYSKPRDIEHSSRSSKSKSPSNSKSEKPGPNMITTFLNRILKLRFNPQEKDSNQHIGNSQYWAGIDRQNILKSYHPEINKGKTLNDGFRTSDDKNSFNVRHTRSNCIECDTEKINMYEEQLWPDVIKTRYPNGMVHFGPLTLMPEPASDSFEWNYEESKHGPKSESCRQYIYNKHMVKASMSRNQQAKGEMSLEEFSETEHEIYHQWSRMGKV